MCGAALLWIHYFHRREVSGLVYNIFYMLGLRAGPNPFRSISLKVLKDGIRHGKYSMLSDFAQSITVSASRLLLRNQFPLFLIQFAPDVFEISTDTNSLGYLRFPISSYSTVSNIIGKKIIFYYQFDRRE